MEFRLLGPFEVWAGGGPVPMGGPRQRAVLAALVIGANDVVTPERFARAAWQRPPRSLHSNLRTYVTALRRLLPDRLATEPDGYRLLVEAGESDLAVFDDLVDRAAGAPPRDAIALYTTALRLWRGEPLSGLPLGPGLDAEVGRLVDRRLHVMEHLAAARIGVGDHDEAIGDPDAAAASCW